MRILVVSSFLPYPLYSGGHVRLFNLLKAISQNHTVTLVCESRDYQTEKDVKEIEKFCEEVITIPRKKQWTWQNVVTSGLSNLPFLLVGHKSQAMKNAIVKKLNDKNFDIIHVETFYVYQNVPKTYIPTVLVEHNVEYKVYERYADTAPAYFRPLLLVDIAKIKHWEQFYWEKADALVAVSEEEARQMKRDVFVVPNGVDTTSFPFKKKVSSRKEKKILFMGDFKWVQNSEAVKKILEEIWPMLYSQCTAAGLSLKLWIVGKNIPDDIKQLGDTSVIFDEHAPDNTSLIYQKADILLAPIYVGGGTSYKILEAMACGVPVVTTKLGVIGLGAKDKKQALVGETASELAAHVESLLTNSSLYESIRLDARKLIEEKFSWAQIAKKLEQVYQKVIQPV